MRRWRGPVAKYLLYAIFAVCVFDRALASQAETGRLLRECRTIRAEIGRIRRQSAAREIIRKALNTAAFYVERLLRDRYGYRRPGEEQRTTGILARSTQR